MLQSLDGIITNALIDEVDDLSRLAQDIRVDVPIRLPSKGVPLTPGTKLCRALYLNKLVDVKGKAMKRTTILDFTARLANEGVVVETVKLRSKYLEFLMQNAVNRANRVRAEREYLRFKQAVAGMDEQSILWAAAVDKAGNMFVSSAGVLNTTDLDLSSVSFSNGISLADVLNEYAGSNTSLKSSVAALNMVKLPELNLAVALNESEVKQAIGLTGCLLTIRGFHAHGRSAEDVMAEWNMVAQPLLEALPDTVFASWDMPWAISTFPGLDISDLDRVRANVVAPYLSAAAGLFVSSASDATIDQTRMITLFKRGQWNFSNNTYTCRYNNRTAVFEPTVNTVIANALAMTGDSLDRVAAQILEAAQVYGKSMGDGSSWARLLWCEWMGINGLLGGLSINASSR